MHKSGHIRRGIGIHFILLTRLSKDKVIDNGYEPFVEIKRRPLGTIEPEYNHHSELGDKHPDKNERNTEENW